MFKSPVHRLYQTSRQLIKVIPESITQSSQSAMSRPTGLIANKGLELLTFGTPNGHKASIILEEIKAAYGTDYVFQSINIMENIQKEPWFTKLGPNGRIPVLVDHDKGGLAIQEGAGMIFPAKSVLDSLNQSDATASHPVILDKELRPRAQVLVHE